MPANKKYFSSPLQRFAKISAGFIGGYFVTVSFFMTLSMLLDRAAINLNQGKRKLLSQGWQIDGFHYIPLFQEGGGKVLELQLSTFLCWSRR